MSGKLYSETSLRALIESFDNPVLFLLEGTVRLANRGYLDLLERGREQVEGRSFLDFLHAGDRARLAERPRQMLEGRLSFPNPSRYLLPLPAGGECELAAHVQEVVLEEGGRGLLVNCLVLGVHQGEPGLSERHHAETREERSQWEMVAVAEAARFVAQPEPPTPAQFLERVAWLLSAETVVLYTSEPSEGVPRLSHAVGLDAPLQALLATPLRTREGAAVDPRGPASCGDAEERLLREASGGRLGHGASVRLEQGELVRGVLQVLRGPGQPFGSADLRLLGILSELLVTLLEQQRLRVEAARQLSETRLLLDLARTSTATLEVASILDTAADFLVKLLDVSNCFIFLFDEQTRTLRGAAASVTHREFFRTVSIPLEDPHSLVARVARERKPVGIPDVSRAMGEYNLELVRRFGQKALLGVPLTSREELIGVVVVDDTRRTRTFAVNEVELTEATCAQLALAIANARLYESLWASYAGLAAARAELVKRERFAAVGEMSAILAHHVRNPLGVIFNAVSSLRRMLKPEGNIALLLNILAEESDRLNRMVGDLLDFTRPREAQLQPENILHVVQEALDAVRSQQGAAEGTITFGVQVEEPLPPVPVDRGQLCHALIKILVNAIQAMPNGGVVQVRARRESVGGREWLRLDVVDTGCGIPTELLHRVFEPFFTTKAQGTGLGLAVVKSIVEEHHGELALESTPGRGTTFTLRLPLQSGSLS
jgi:PAS domain S-box-containing protein